MKQETKTLRERIGNVIWIMVVIVAVICIVQSVITMKQTGVPSVFGAHFLSVQTESMIDTIVPGDLIVVTRVRDVSTLERGDIITYWTVIHGVQVLNTHRIVDIFEENGQLQFETRGDNNLVNDPLKVEAQDIVGRYRFQLPLIGHLIDFFKTPIGLTLFITVPAVIFFVTGAIRLIGDMKSGSKADEDDHEDPKR